MNGKQNVDDASCTVCSWDDSSAWTAGGRRSPEFRPRDATNSPSLISVDYLIWGSKQKRAYKKPTNVLKRASFRLGQICVDEDQLTSSKCGYRLLACAIAKGH